MTRKTIFLSLAGVSVFGLLLFSVHTQAAAPEMKGLKIGVISPQSEPIAYFGMSVLRGAETAIKNINAKGTIGNGPGILVGNQRYKLEIVSYDDSGDPAKSVAGMRKLSDMYKVPVILGPFGTPQVWPARRLMSPLESYLMGCQPPINPERRGTASTSRSASRGFITAIPWPRPLSTRASERPAC